MSRVLLRLISYHLEFIINYQRFIYLQFIVKKNYTFFESIYARHLSLVLQNDLKIQKPPVVTLEARQSLRCVALLRVGRHDSHSPRCQLAPHFGLAAVVV